jgi:SAM-dependent methyltransferase
VIATDLAPGMIETARRLAAERGLANVLVQFAEAAALPFADASFDLVTCRIAPHHFPDVPGFVAEAARVLKARGRFVLEDSLAPDDPETAAFLDDLEKRRDRTHVHSLSEAEWRAAIAGAGLGIVRETVYAKVHDFALWIGRTGLSESEIAAIKAHVLAAPPAVRAALFDIAEETVRHLRDRKLILRAERHGTPSTRSAATATDLR